MKKYTMHAIIKRRDTGETGRWIGWTRDESRTGAMLSLTSLIEDRHVMPLIAWMDADGKPEWLECYVDERGRFEPMGNILRKMKEQAAEWMALDGLESYDVVEDLVWRPGDPCDVVEDLV